LTEDVAPQLVIGKRASATFRGGRELVSWPIAGTLRGVLEASVLRFEQGEEQVLGRCEVAADELRLDGQILVLVSEDASGARSLELKLAVSPSDQPGGNKQAKSWSQSQPQEAFDLPTTKLLGAAYSDG